MFFTLLISCKYKDGSAYPQSLYTIEMTWLDGYKEVRQYKFPTGGRFYIMSSQGSYSPYFKYEYYHAWLDDGVLRIKVLNEEKLKQ